MAELSGNFLYAAFLVYLIAVPIFGGAIRGNKDKKGRPNRWANIGITLSIVGFLPPRIFHHKVGCQRPCACQQYV